MNKPSVFISYSHQDEIWKDRLLKHLKPLEQVERITLWHDRKIDAGDKWFPKIEKAIKRATVAVCLISADYLSSDFCVKEEIPFLLNESEKRGLRIIPLLVRSCPWEEVSWVKQRQMLPRDGKSLAEDFQGKEDRALVEVARAIVNPAEETDDAAGGPQSRRWKPPQRVDISRMPSTTSEEVFGREEEVRFLINAWDAGALNVISFVAWGGVGKSTLINSWLQRMASDNYRGAQLVLAWSFYSQGTDERVTSADQFINYALEEWFGEKKFKKASPWSKGERLAELARRKKTLMVLDGMEPLQSSFDYERGRIKDPALAIFLAEMARENSGLCVITTREPVADLRSFSATTHHQRLDQVSAVAGRALLNARRIRGTDAQLEEATRNFGYHALALSLLAAYLRGIPGHHITPAYTIPDIDVPPEQGKHPRRVIAAFERRFGEGAEVEMLRILGLFNRPAKVGEIDAVRAAPPIRKLTEHTHKLSEGGWLNLLEKLRSVMLVARKGEHLPEVYDAHPLVREHFGQQLKRRYSQAWREGNNRLFEHLKGITKNEPKDIEEMAPLYAAVAHGCEAGRQQEALDEVYWRQILRGEESFIPQKHGEFEEFFSTRRFGAFSYDLAALTGFFDEPWHRPIEGLRDSDKAFVQNQAGFRLRALGRVVDAIEPIKGSLEAHIVLKDWRYSAIDAGHLSYLYLMVGDISNAIKRARESIKLADKSKHDFWRVRQRTTLGNALHHAGRFAEAEKAFRDAEAMQEMIFGEAKRKRKECPFALPRLYSLWGFHYCDLLISLGKYEEVIERATITLEWAKSRDFPRDVALDNLALGLACLSQNRQGQAKDFEAATAHLKEAVKVMRQAGFLDYLLRGLLARAELHRTKGDLIHAKVDLDEAISIATRGGMSLLQADCHLGYARLFLAQADRQKAKESFDTAREMIRQMGYYRRKVDLSRLARQLSSPVNRV